VTQYQLVTVTEQIGIVDKDDRVVDRDSRQQNRTDEGLHIEGRLRQEEGQADPDRRERDREENDQRIA
jgi:hypothetical protein